MQRKIHPAIASQHYRMLEIKSRVESASPNRLVGLLYEELLRSLDLCVASAAKGFAISGSPHTAKALSIIVTLESSLDFEKGGDLAQNLARVYRSCRQNLNDAAKTSDLQKLTEIREAVSSITYAWQALTGN